MLVADIDMISNGLFQLREQSDGGEDAPFKFDNVPFVLNALDSLAGDERFLELRKRRPEHRTLVRFEERTREAEKKVIEERRERRARSARTKQKGAD